MFKLTMLVAVMACFAIPQAALAASPSEWKTPYIIHCPEADPYIDRLNQTRWVPGTEYASSMVQAANYEAIANAAEKCAGRLIKSPSLPSVEAVPWSINATGMAGDYLQMALSLYAQVINAYKKAPKTLVAAARNLLVIDAHNAYLDFDQIQQESPDADEIRMASRRKLMIENLVSSYAPDQLGVLRGVNQ